MKKLLFGLLLIAAPAFSQVRIEKTVSINNITGTTNSASINLYDSKHLSIQCVIDVNTPAAKTYAGVADVDPSTNYITEPSHGYYTGLKGQMTTVGTLPTGVSAGVDYFIIKVDADNYEIATSLVNALAGTAVDITADGVGNSTFTPTAIAGATVKLQKSNDNSTWDDVASAASITVDGDVWFEIPNSTQVGLNYHYVRLQYTLTAGMMSTDNYIFAKGNN